jgi:hypothetical protein
VDVSGAITRLEAMLSGQVRLAGGDEAVDEAATTLLSVLAPAVRQLALDLAQQAAEEVAAQAPHLDVEVVLRDGDPMLRLRHREPEASGTDPLEARLTLRLPEDLKRHVQELADASGDSVNSWVVRALSGARQARATGRRPSGTSGEFLT